MILRSDPLPHQDLRTYQLDGPVSDHFFTCHGIALQAQAQAFDRMTCVPRGPVMSVINNVAATCLPVPD